MHKFVVLILKNVFRSKLRTVLTASAVMVLAAVFVVQQAIMSKVRSMIEAQGSQTKLLVSERWIIPSLLPVRYVKDLAQLEGVDDWAAWRLYSGYLDDSGRQDRLALGVATRMDNLRAMTQDMEDLSPAAVEEMQHERTGALVGSALMESLGWKVGQKFTCQSISHPGKDLDFKVVGILPAGVWATYFFFRDDYFESGTGNQSTVNYVWLRTGSPELGTRVARSIREKFESGETELKVETESAGVARFAKRNQLLFGVIRLVSAILVLDMVLILSNSISLTTRERSKEFSVLRALGFRTGHILTLVIGEAVCIGALSGALGATLAWLFFFLGSQGLLTQPVTSITSIFSIPLATWLQAVGVGVLVGVVGSVVPAWTARKVNMVDMLAKVA